MRVALVLAVLGFTAGCGVHSSATTPSSGGNGAGTIAGGSTSSGSSGAASTGSGSSGHGASSGSASSSGSTSGTTGLTVGDYYVDAAHGSDANTGRSLQTPFATIQRCAAVLAAGQTCLVRAGTYGETVTPAASGAPGQPIVFAPYGMEQVVVSGADEVTAAWQLAQGSIYSAPVRIAPSLVNSGFANQVFLADTGLDISARMLFEARWPGPAGATSPFDLPQAIVDGGTATAGQGGTLYDPALTFASGALTGATLQMRAGYAWSSQSAVVTGNGAGWLTYAGGTEDCADLCAVRGSRYDVVGLRALLTQPAEWFYDAAAQKLWMWTPAGDSPSNHRVMVKQRELAFDLSNRSHVEVRGFRIFAATLRTNGGSHNLIDGISASYLSHFIAFSDSPYSTHTSDTGIQLAGTGDVLQNSTLQMSAGNLVALEGRGESATNNLILNGDYSATYCAPVNVTDGTARLTHNTIRGAGRDVVHISSGTTDPGLVIQENDISVGGLLNQDIGLLYTCCGGDFTGSTIDHNWLHDVVPADGRGFGNGTYPAISGNGIYFDNGTTNITAHHNVVWNASRTALTYNGVPGTGSSHGVHFFNNTVGLSERYGASSAFDANSADALFVNNIFSEAAVAKGAYALDGGGANENLVPPTDPRFVRPSGPTPDFHLNAASPARGAGVIIPGSTSTARPDQGAYEGPDWTPGCSLPGC